jgi:AAA+ superfamily predicted ATPase
MAKSVVVYGPQGSGKTRYGRAIAEKHGLTRVIDLEDVQLMGERLQRQGFLYLSCSEGYAGRAAKLLGTSVIHIDQALVSIGVDAGVAHG